MSEENNIAVGIDLGTTNSCVALDSGSGNPEVLVNREGGRTTPSVFAITKSGNKLVGQTAVNQEGLNAVNTVRSIKRKMGGADKIELMGKNLSPEQISAEILKKIKEDCEDLLGGPVHSAVITVPAYFNHSQREATKNAGELAGFNVLRIISEPTAAAVAYGLDKKKNETVLVYDLGGGTFDVTLLKITGDNVFEVLATSGDPYLGGDDFDAVLFNRLYNELVKLAGWSKDKEADPPVRARLREAAESAKKQLSTSVSVDVNLPFVAQNQDNEPVHLALTLYRADFEEDIEGLIEKTKKCVNQTLSDAKLTFGEIDEVIFVGGSTRVPAVIKAVKEWTGKNPNRSVNPDEAVAMGAAIQASVLSGNNTSDSMPILLDVIPITLGIETQGGVFTPMVTRNTTIPFERLETFSTVEDAQTQVIIRVFQGERPKAEDNKVLGEFYLKDIPPAPRGIAKIDVKFDVDANAVLHVTAIDKATKREQKLTISGSTNLTADEIQKILSDAELHAEEDALFREKSDVMRELEMSTIQYSDLIRKSGHLFSEEELDELKEMKESLEKAREYENVEVIRALVASAHELAMESGKKLYEKAEAETKQANDSTDEDELTNQVSRNT